MLRRVAAILALCVACKASALAADGLASVVALHASLSPDLQRRATLYIATDAHYPPCESFAADNRTMIGYEPDLWHEIARRLGLSVRDVSIGFDGLIPGVESGRYDLAMECMTDSAEREEQVRFVDYAYAAPAVVYTLATQTSISPDRRSLCGRHGASQIGMDFNAALDEASEACTANSHRPILLSLFPSINAALMALFAGRVDFVVDDSTAAPVLKATAPEPVRVVDIGLPKLIVGAAIRSDNKSLGRALLQAFRSMQADGTTARILARWGLSDLALPSPGFDLAANKPRGAP